MSLVARILKINFENKKLFCATKSSENGEGGKAITLVRDDFIVDINVIYRLVTMLRLDVADKNFFYFKNWRNRNLHKTEIKENGFVCCEGQICI